VTDYTTTDVVKRRLAISDAAWDTDLKLLVTMASRAIDRWCGRPDNGFIGQVQTRIYDVPAPAAPDRGPLGYETMSQTVDLDPLLAITTVAPDLDGDGVYETVWAPGDYTLLPINASLNGRPYDQIRSHDWTSLGGKRFPTGQARLQLVGTWGESVDVPPLIAEATFLVTSRAFSRRKQPYGLTEDTGAGTSRIPTVDPDVDRLLYAAGYKSTNSWWFV